MRKPLIDKSIFKERRRLLASRMKTGALVLPAHPEYLRNHDVHHEYRQDTNLFYLTGFEEPGAVLVFRPGQDPETTLFVRPKDPTRETWDGFRYGPDLAAQEFGLDQCFAVDQLDIQLPELLKACDPVYYRLNFNDTFDRKMMSALEIVKASRGRSGAGLQTLMDSSEILGEMRLIKSKEEIEWMQKASDIAAQAHINAMKFARPGVTERQLQAVIEYTAKMAGSPRMGYGSIVATGANATTLHYVFNDQVCKDGELLLIDAGVEWNYYSSDITRTFPVSAKFRGVQKELYQAVLSVQKSLIDSCRVGHSIKQLQETTIEKLTEIMLDFKLLSGSKSDIIQKQTFKKYYPHGVSHWLGMDVHDAGLYNKDGGPRKFEPGMCLTIEPGIYIPVNDMDAPQEFRGIGIRIEDDIIIQNDVPLVLTAKAPKEINAIESLVGTS